MPTRIELAPHPPRIKLPRLLGDAELVTLHWRIPVVFLRRTLTRAVKRSVGRVIRGLYVTRARRARLILVPKHLLLLLKHARAVTRAVERRSCALNSLVSPDEEQYGEENGDESCQTADHCARDRAAGQVR